MKISNILAIFMIFLINLTSVARVFSLHNEDRKEIQFYIIYQRPLTKVHFAEVKKEQDKGLVTATVKSKAYYTAESIFVGPATIQIYEKDQLLLHCVLGSYDADLHINYNDKKLRPQRGRAAKKITDEKSTTDETKSKRVKRPRITSHPKGTGPFPLDNNIEAKSITCEQGA